MKIVVFGLWHQGSVAAACTARYFPVVGLDFDAANIADLAKGKAPLFEPQLNERLQQRLETGMLRFTTDITDACRDANILWVTFDTPVDDNDESDSETVINHIVRCIPSLPHGALVLLSSQLPVGTCQRLERKFGPEGYRFACSPENLRLGRAISTFENAERIVVGCRDEQSRTELKTIFDCFTKHIVWMSCESAEMTKHALNSFLALSITYMNEIARLCEAAGADAKEVEFGLKSEPRIGPGAYLSPGGPFAGGTLARDVVTLGHLGEKHGESLELIPAIKRSNDRHRGWAFQKIQKAFGGQAGRHVTLLGLTYKAGTNTLRRSAAIELARSLHTAGIVVRAFDPSRPELPAELNFIASCGSAYEAAEGSDALVLCTDWPEFHELDWAKLVPRMREPRIFDATRYVARLVAGLPGVMYSSVGLPTP